MSKVLLTLLFLFMSLAATYAQESRTVNERLAALEEGQKAIHQRIDDVNNRIGDVNNRIDGLETSLNNRIDDLRADMNERFNDMNRKFNWLYILISAVIILNGAMVSSVIWLARQERPIGKRQYDGLMDKDFEIEERVRTLELQVKQLETAKS